MNFCSTWVRTWEHGLLFRPGTSRVAPASECLHLRRPEKWQCLSGYTPAVRVSATLTVKPTDCSWVCGLVETVHVFITNPITTTVIADTWCCRLYQTSVRFSYIFPWGFSSYGLFHSTLRIHSNVLLCSKKFWKKIYFYGTSTIDNINILIIQN